AHAGYAFDFASQDRISERRIMEFGSRLKIKWFGFEKIERIDNRTVMMGAFVFFLGIFIMPDSSQMAKQFSCCDGPLLLRISGAIFLSRRIQIDLSGLNQLHDCSRGDGFRN